MVSLLITLSDLSDLLENGLNVVTDAYVQSLRQHHDGHAPVLRKTGRVFGAAGMYVHTCNIDCRNVYYLIKCCSLCSTEA